MEGQSRDYGLDRVVMVVFEDRPLDSMPGPCGLRLAAAQPQSGPGVRQL
jgi:hypothetical protein